MKTYAWIYDGVVSELKRTAGDISTMFHPSFVWVEVPNGVAPAVGWTAHQTDGEWSFSPPEVPAPTPSELKVLIADERFLREASGVCVEGLGIETTRDSQSLVASTGLSAVLDPQYRCNFKTTTGFVEIGAAQIIAIAKAVRAHVQACFDREMALLLAIEAGTFRDEMLAEGWPDSSPPDPAELQ